MVKNVPILHSAEWDKTNLSDIIPHDENSLICDNNVQSDELNSVSIFRASTEQAEIVGESISIKDKQITTKQIEEEPKRVQTQSLRGV